MPDHDFDGGQFQAPYAGHPHVDALFTLLSLLWIAVPLLLAWAAIRAARPQPVIAAAEEPQISAMEMLRRRYVLGDIDETTFEQMLEHLLDSESREERMRRIAEMGWPDETQM